MKELDLFEQWATSVIDERRNKRDDPIDNDIMSQAHRQMPHLSPERALAVYVANQLKDLNTKDLEQNKVINAQRKQNSELNNTVGQLQQELHHADTEIDRIKKLSGTSAKSAEERKVSVQEIERLLHDVDQLKDKPGISDEEHDDLKNKVEQFKEKAVDKDEYNKFQQHIEELLDRKEVSKEELDALTSIAADVAATEKQTSNIAQKIQADVEKIKNLEAQINANKVDTDRMKTAVNSLNKQKNKFKAQIDKNKEIVSKNQEDIKLQTVINAAQTKDIFDLEDELNVFKNKGGADVSPETDTTSPASQNANEVPPEDNQSFDPAATRGARSWAGVQINKTINPEREKALLDAASSIKKTGPNTTPEEKSKNTAARMAAMAKIHGMSYDLLKDALSAPTEDQFVKFIDLIQDKIRTIMTKAGRSSNSTNQIINKIKKFAPSFEMTDDQVGKIPGSIQRKEAWLKTINDYTKSINDRRKQKYSAKKATTTEPYTHEIDTMAERILGEQYGKYLK